LEIKFIRFSTRFKTLSCDGVWTFWSVEVERAIFPMTCVSKILIIHPRKIPRRPASQPHKIMIGNSSRWLSPSTLISGCFWCDSKWKKIRFIHLINMKSSHVGVELLYDNDLVWGMTIYFLDEWTSAICFATHNVNVNVRENFS
jgi:hypothetical protein